MEEAEEPGMAKEDTEESARPARAEEPGMLKRGVSGEAAEEEGGSNVTWRPEALLLGTDEEGRAEEEGMGDGFAE